MQFIHQALAWGFLIALAPVLIHLINMMRHRRVKWAAMEFLLQSYRKHRRWVWLKQLLLLLMRMAAVALIVAMLAGWISREKWLAIFGERTTHHYVLLDDSYSMSERAGGASAFERGLKAVRRIAAQGRQVARAIHEVIGHEDKQDRLHAVKAEPFCSLIPYDERNTAGHAVGLRGSCGVLAAHRRIASGKGDGR